MHSVDSYICLEFCTIEMVDYWYILFLWTGCYSFWVKEYYYLTNNYALPPCKSEQKTAPASPVPLLSEFKPEKIRMLHKFDWRLFCVYFRSTRRSLKLVLWPTSTRTVQFKVRMHVSIAIHRLRKSSGKPTKRIYCEHTNGKKKEKRQAKSDGIPLALHNRKRSYSRICMQF